MPVYNDWESASLVWDRLDQASGNMADTCLRVVCVDDGSTTDRPQAMAASQFSHIAGISILRLRRNVGHQRAFAIGLTYIYQHMACDAVICMDADGEDRPEDLSQLLECFESHNRTLAVFAARRKRLEGRVFRTGYQLFRLAHRLLVGFGIKIGNFSVLSFHQLSALVVSPDLWSHYAATVLKLRIPMATLPINRGPRLAGHSRMNYISLVTHGLSAFSVFAEVVATRVLIGGSAVLFLITLVTVGLIGLHSYDGSIGVNWITMTLALLFLVTMNAVIIALASAFGALARRDQLGFLPIRDASYFVSDFSTLYENTQRTYGCGQFYSKNAAN